MQELYDPHRLLYPMKRTNPTKSRDEDPGWERIGWDEAYDTIAQHLSLIHIYLLALAYCRGKRRRVQLRSGGSAPFGQKSPVTASGGIRLGQAPLRP